MPNVYMKEVEVVQTIGPGGIGVTPPVPVETVEKISGNVREMKEVTSPAGCLPNPIGTEDGTIIEAKDDSWQSGGFSVPNPANATDGMVLAVEDGEYVIADASVQTDVQDLVADPYSTEGTYAVGDVVVYQNALYRCITAIGTAEAWTAAHWEAKNMAEIEADDYSSLKSAISNVTIKSKNLLPIAKKEATVNEVDIVYEDGYITMSGTGTASTGRLTPITDSFTLDAGTYIFSFLKVPVQVFVETGSTILAQLNGSSSSSSSFTLESSTVCYLGINTGENTVYDLKFYVQLEKGATQTYFLKPSFFSAIDEEMRNAIVTPEMYGAVGDGITKDGAAVQAALDSGGIVVGNGIYNIGSDNPYSDYVYINIPNGSHLIGGTYKFPDNGSSSESQAGINAFVGNKFCIENVTFDMNGYNNIPTPTKTMYAVFVDNCGGVIIRGCKFKNSAGRDYIFVKQGSNFRLEDCTFKNGGTNIEGSDATKQNDFSYVYTSADESIITGCLIDVPDDDPFTYCGGFELHGNNSILENCVINNCLPAVYIAKHQTNNDPNYNVKVLNNTILNCQGGVSCFANHTLDNIEVSGNYITLKPITPVAEGMYGIGASRNTQSNFKAVGNTIIQAEASENGCSGISIGHTTGAEVTFNILKNIPYPIYIYGNDTNSDIVIEHNLITSSADSANYAITRQNTSAAISKLTILENEVQKYAGLLNSISAVTDYLVLDRILDMKYLIERSKNLLPIGDFSATVVGADVSYKSGVVTASGTATSSGGRLTPITPYFTLPAGKYTFGMSYDHGPLQAFIESGSTIITQVNGSGSSTFTLTGETTLYVGINFGAGAVDSLVYLELESGESVGTFIPSGAYTAVDAVARAAIST